MSEKTEKATAYALQKAKEKGQVNKSTDLNSCVFLLITFCLITALWPKQLHGIKTILRQLLYLASHFQFNIDKVSYVHQLILSQILGLWLPIALGGMLALILTSTAQTGLVWSPTSIIPDFKRLNFIQGFKKLFSVKTCFDTIKSTLKLTSASILIYFSLKHTLPHILSLIFSHPAQDPQFFMSILVTFTFQLIILLTVFAVIDKVYTQWKYNKDHRMSKQEVKEEWKQREGDPKIKNKLKQLQHQLRQKTTSIKEIKTADVVITNPTHIAIALKYERGIMPAPKVVCKVQGEMVREVKRLAKKYNVPVIENKIFARLLNQTIELNQFISNDLFPIAAGIFREIYQQRNNK